MAVPAAAGHVYGGFYKYGGHAKYCGPPKRTFVRAGCHAKPGYRGYGYGKWRPSGPYGKPVYGSYGLPGANYGHHYRSGYRGEMTKGGYDVYGSGMQSSGGVGYPGRQSHGGPVSKDIIDTATAAGGFSTLISAVTAAGLVATLEGDGPFTVLAPNDAAFSKLPKERVSALMSDPEALKGVLSYHVISGRLTAADLLEQGSVETISGDTVNLTQLDVAKADVDASNGIIHVLDAVLVPPE